MASIYSGLEGSVDNDVLMGELTGWAERTAKIDPNHFDCAYVDACNASTGGKLSKGKGCHMSYLGRRYGEKLGDLEFRLMFVGIDPGEREKSFTFQETRDGKEGIETLYPISGCRFNQHYEGIAKTAAAVFGEAGARCRRDCIRSCNKKHDVEPTFCALNHIIQANMVKCVRSDADSRKSKSTPRMKKNCLNHLIVEIQVTRPSLIVFQGVDARYFVLPKLRELDANLAEVSDIRDEHGQPVLYNSRQFNTHLLFLKHPSYNHLTSQWLPVVVPALQYLRGNGHIPA
jgi:hypothetical protein